MCQHFIFMAEYFNHTYMYMYHILFMDTWIVSTFWLLWIVLLWRLLYKSLLSVILGICPGVEQLDYNGNSVWNILMNHRGYTILYSHQQCMRVPVSLHSPQTFVIFHFLKIAILMGVKVSKGEQKVVILKYAPLAWGLFWAEGSWGLTDSRRDLFIIFSFYLSLNCLKEFRVRACTWMRANTRDDCLYKKDLSAWQGKHLLTKHLLLPSSVNGLPPLWSPSPSPPSP